MARAAKVRRITKRQGAHYGALIDTLETLGATLCPSCHDYAIHATRPCPGWSPTFGGGGACLNAPYRMELAGGLEAEELAAESPECRGGLAMGYRLDTPDKRAASRASYTARITAPAFTESLLDGSLVLAYEEGGKAFSIAFAGTGRQAGAPLPLSRAARRGGPTRPAGPRDRGLPAVPGRPPESRGACRPAAHRAHGVSDHARFSEQCS